jgi:hypothetical protein
MATFLLAALIFGLLFAGMAIGVIFQNKPIKGTCGGLNQMTGGSCEICGGDPNKCDSEDESPASKADPAALAYDATKTP